MNDKIKKYSNGKCLEKRFKAKNYKNHRLKICFPKNKFMILTSDSITNYFNDIRLIYSSKLKTLYKININDNFTKFKYICYNKKNFFVIWLDYKNENKFTLHLKNIFYFFIKNNVFFYHYFDNIINYGNIWDFEKDIYQPYILHIISGYKKKENKKILKYFRYIHLITPYLIFTQNEIIVDYIVYIYENYNRDSEEDNLCVQIAEVFGKGNINDLVFLLDISKNKLSKKQRKWFLELISCDIFRNEHIYFENIIKTYGIKFFELLYEYNFHKYLYLFFLNYYIPIIHDFIGSALEYCPEIIEYVRINFFIDNDFNKYVLLNDYKILIKILDDFDTFKYAIEYLTIKKDIMDEFIKKSGSFIRKEFVEILIISNKLDNTQISKLKKYIKNNPDKKQIKKLL